MADELDWIFSLRAGNLETLKKVSDEMNGEFDVQLQESVEEVDVDGNSSIGDPLLSVIRTAALTPEEVKAIAEKLGSIADERGLVYQGVGCYDPIDDDELFGWLDPDAAAWRLRHFSDCGLEENGDIPWTFLVATTDLAQTQKLAAGLNENGFDDLDVYDEPDEDGNFDVLLFVAGRNNEAELAETCAKITRLAEQHSGQLGGVQFFSREVMDDLFGDDESE